MPTIAEAMALAEQHYQGGNFPAAEQLCRQILLADPRHADALHLLGILAYGAGQCDLAGEYIEAALQVNETDARYHNSLGIVRQRQGRIDEATASYQRALALQPGLAEVHSNLGTVFKNQGKIADALACYERALERNPDYAEAHNNLGNLWKLQGRTAEALACYRRALQLKPDSAEVYTNIASILREKEHRLDEALAYCQHALRLRPQTAEAHDTLGSILKDMGLLDEAVAAQRRAVELHPASPAFHSNLICTLHYHPASDPAPLREEARRWNDRHAAPLAHHIKPHGNHPDPERRLRVGYVSPDFRGHPVGLFLLPLLTAHDRGQVEVFCYSSVAVADQTTQRLRHFADCWRDVASLTDEQRARLVREDAIDILVDLSAHMSGHCLLTFARKPAPVQVTYLAYCSTTGVSAIDYRLTDPFLDTPCCGMVSDHATASEYTEQSVWLPESYWCYQPVIEVEAAGPLPARGAGHTTFGCLNNFCKATEPALALWRELLRGVPDAHLLLHAHPGSHRDRVRHFFAAGGVAPERIAFSEAVSLPEYFDLYHRIDIGLDPFPYGGGTTTFDALWMGVPVVSLVGRTAVGRAGLSILSNAGLPELVARTPEEYLNIAAGLAADLPRLEELRAGLRTRLQRSPLTDAVRFAGSIETAYRAMWRRWCASLRNSPSM
jgi:protein O-GlcNAc transferase